MPLLIVLAIWSGIVNGFDLPSRSAFVVGLVDDRKDLPAAIAMNATLMNVTRLIGPALAGFIVSIAGEGICFLLNALSYIAVIGALLFIRGHFAPPAKAVERGMFDEFIDGLRYTWQTSPVRTLIVLLAVFGFGGMAYALLLPVFVKDIHGNANTLGLLMAGSAVGSLVGTLLLSRREHIIGLGRWIMIASFCYALALIGFSFAHSFVTALCALLVIGFTMMLQIASANTILQSIVEEDKRGRVMSLFSMAFLGTAPLGSLLGGAIANRIGFNMTILICGIYCLIVAALFASQLQRLRAEARPIYIEKGLLTAEQEVDILTQ
jgi:MFS family permease